MEEAKIIAQLLKVLSNENRLFIVCQLLDRPMTVTELQEAVGQVSQAAISQHLATLKAHQLVDSMKEGMYVRYGIADERLKIVLETLKLHYCPERASLKL